jgi:hypothetical protein
MPNTSASSCRSLRLLSVLLLLPMSSLMLLPSRRRMT